MHKETHIIVNIQTNKQKKEINVNNKTHTQTIMTEMNKGGNDGDR